MRRRLLTLLILSVLLATGASAGRVGAGGWAVTTLDEVPPVVAGDTVPVGFVIRQHGVTPAALDADVGVEVRSPSGRAEYFAAAPDGAVGHYVAHVTFAEAGTSTWRVHQGWFGPQDLGSIVVTAAGAPAVEDVSRPDWPPVVRFGLPVLALIAAAAVVVGDVIRGRRKAVA
ncbi:MAG: hypothetical protein QM733_21115 [Ilumatobacteraceae bacterium]